jgi:hypothetical protein
MFLPKRFWLNWKGHAQIPYYARRIGPNGYDVFEAHCADAELFCDYETGMIGPSIVRDESCNGGVEQSPPRYLLSVAIHEAWTCDRVIRTGPGLFARSLAVDVREETAQRISYRSEGEFFSGRRAAQMAMSALRFGRVSPTVIGVGIVIAAGPAAERRFRLRLGLPVDHHHYCDDRDLMDQTASCLARPWRSRFAAAYKRLVWRRAQVMIASDIIWHGVDKLAEALVKDYWPAPTIVGENSRTMPGASAPAILKSAVSNRVTF